jgi:hypothetical protein
VKTAIDRFNTISRVAGLVLVSCLVACSGGGNNNPAFVEALQPAEGPQALRNYELTAQEGSFSAAAEDGDDNAFELTLSGVSEALFFTNQGVLEAGSDPVSHLVNSIWPTEYETTGPNAVLQYSAAGEFHDLSCILNTPTYDESTGLLKFTVSYLDGVRPVEGENLQDVKIIITKNAQELHPEQWSTILNGETATLDETDNPDEYLLTITGLADHIFAAAAAPHRNALRLTSDDLISRWEEEEENNLPSASLSYSVPRNAEAGVQVLELTNPVYDSDRDMMQFTARPLYGTTPIGGGMSVNHPTLTIDGAVEHAFPTADENHFSIQYRNNTAEAITVWLNGAQPPCSKTEAVNCVVGAVPDHYKNDWKQLKESFKKSGTRFYIIDKNAKHTREIEVTNRIHLDRGQILRIVPPLGADNHPQWYYSAGGTVQTAGVTGWVTRPDVNMPAPMQVNLFEYNLDYAQLTLWADISAVDGLNSNATMMWAGPGCGKPDCGTGVSMPRRLMTNIEPYKDNNDGCPHIMEVAGARTCPNPKHYPAQINTGQRPSWVVGNTSFDTEKVSSDYATYWTNAGSPDGLQMCAAASGLAAPKEAYHIWWATNSVGMGWLNYLQKNKKGRCDAYGWAYDEKKWKPGDTFDKNGNPPDNTSVTPQFAGPMKNDTYLNIDVLKIM